MEKRNLDKLTRVLDFLLEHDEPQQHFQTKECLASDEQMRKLRGQLEQILKPLSAWEDESPDADLTGRTLKFIKQHQETAALVGAAYAAGPRQPLPERATPSRGRWILHNLSDLAAAAACIMLVFVLMNPSLKHARQIAQQQACSAQLRQVGLALEQYAQDHNGLITYVQRGPLSKWWNVGRQEGQNISNTGNLYLLVKNGYLPVETFLCPGRDDHKVRVRIKLDPQLLKTLQDFAGREDINYSFRLILNNQPLQSRNTFSLPFVTDQNPLFADFDAEKQDELDLSAHLELQQVNSPNHAGRGQNLLFSDGRVIFSPDRRYGLDPDDIFTIQSTMRYRGNERPRSEKDHFIAP